MAKDNSTLWLLGAAAVVGYLVYKKSANKAIAPAVAATPQIVPASDVSVVLPKFDPPEVQILKILDPDDLGAGPDVNFVW